MSRFKDDYRLYKRFMTDPVLALLIAGICPILYHTTKTQSLAEALLLGVLLVIASSFLGSRAVILWTQVIQQGELSFRGKLAVRSTALFLRNIERLEARLTQLLNRHVKNPASEVEVKSHLEEVILTCRGVREEAFASIENWSDLLPGVDGRARLADITSIQTQLGQAAHSVNELKRELGSSKLAGDERESLVKKYSQKQQTQESLESELMNLSLAYDRSLLSGLQPPATFASVLTMLNRTDAKDARWVPHNGNGNGNGKSNGALNGNGYDHGTPAAE